MFERFSDAARRAVVTAQQDARERSQDEIRSENVLMGLLDAPSAPGAILLRQLGVDRSVVDEAIRRRDDAALAALGIDADEVRRRTEETFGRGALDRGRRRRRGHLPFARGTKKALELALREAIRLGDRHIGTEHVLLGLLHDETGSARDVLAGHGVTLAAMRAAVAELGRGAASG